MPLEAARTRLQSHISTIAEKIVTEAHALSRHARAFAAERLIESLGACPGDDLFPAWRDEFRKRCREMDEGSVELREAADVFAEAYVCRQTTISTLEPE